MTAIPRSKKVSLIAMFTALAIMLNFALSVPAPYASFLKYEVWEVPILVAVLLMGFWSGATVAVLNALILQLQPGALPTGPAYNLIAEVSMIAGVLLVQRIGQKAKWRQLFTWGTATFSGAATRTAVMTLVNAAVLPQPYPIGFSLPADAIPGLLVLIGIFNFTVTLYTVPLAYSVTRAIVSRYHPVFAKNLSL